MDINRCREVSLVIGWIGMMRFTGYEAQGIEPLVAQWAKRTQGTSSFTTNNWPSARVEARPGGCS